MLLLGGKIESGKILNNYMNVHGHDNVNACYTVPTEHAVLIASV